MDLAKLYGIYDLDDPSIIKVDDPKVRGMKVVLINWLTTVITHQSFISEGIITDVLEGKEELDAALGDIIRCSSELIDATLESMEIVNQEYLQAIGMACLIIAIKIMGAHDWIYGDVDYYTLVSGYSSGKGSSPRSLRFMERDILERTNWKGCPSSFIHTPEESFFGLRHKSRHSGRKSRHSGRKSRHSGRKHSSKSRHSGRKHSRHSGRKHSRHSGMRKY